MRTITATAIVAALTTMPAPSAHAADPSIACTKSGSELTIRLQADTPTVQLFTAPNGDVLVGLANNWVLECWDAKFNAYNQGSLNSIVVTEAADTTPTSWSLLGTAWKPTITFDLDPIDSVGVGPTSDATTPATIEAAPGAAAALSFDGSPSSAELLLTTVPQMTFIRVSGTTDDVIDLSDSAATYPGATTIDPGPGSDKVNGGSGDDTVVLRDDGSVDSARGNGGYDQLKFLSTDGHTGAVVDPTTPGGDGVQRLDDVSDFEQYVGTDGPDRFVAPPGGMTAVGLNGNDTFVSGPGDDTFYGRSLSDWAPFETDVVDWSGSSAGITLTSMTRGTDDATGDGHDHLVAISSIVGSSFNDHFTDPSAFWVRPGPGDDTVTAGSHWIDLIAEAGPDGNDTAIDSDPIDWNYAARTAPLSLTADGVANDGLPGEHDNIVIRAGSERVGRSAIQGGSAADVIRGSAYTEGLVGGPGNDRMYGGGGRDYLQGNDGDDVMDGGAAANGGDTFDGGPGVDRVSYAARTAPVVADIDGTADDGAVGEMDNILSGTEVVIGGHAADRLTGSNAAERLEGGPGPDVLRGGGGSDTLYGQAGNDLFYALDRVRDILDGGLGTDRARRDSIDVLRSVEGTF